VRAWRVVGPPCRGSADGSILAFTVRAARIEPVPLPSSLWRVHRWGVAPRCRQTESSRVHFAFAFVRVPGPLFRGVSMRGDRENLPRAHASAASARGSKSRPEAAVAPSLRASPSRRKPGDRDPPEEAPSRDALCPGRPPAPLFCFLHYVSFALCPSSQHVAAGRGTVVTTSHTPVSERHNSERWITWLACR
jgi:hypothetical protein